MRPRPLTHSPPEPTVCARLRASVYLLLLPQAPPRSSDRSCAQGQHDPGGARSTQGPPAGPLPGCAGYDLRWISRRDRRPGNQTVFSCQLNQPCCLAVRALYPDLLCHTWVTTEPMSVSFTDAEQQLQALSVASPNPSARAACTLSAFSRLQRRLSEQSSRLDVQAGIPGRDFDAPQPLHPGLEVQLGTFRACQVRQGGVQRSFL